MAISSARSIDRTFLRKVIKQYATSRPGFYTLIRPQEAWFFHREEPRLKPPILDFGCGDGFFAQLTGLTLPLDYGLDLKGSGIDSPLAKKTYRERLKYNGGIIPLKDNSVQTIISNCVFEHVSDIDLSFKEMFRVLKPGGILAATMAGENWDKFLLGGALFGSPYRNWFRAKQVHRNLFSFDQWHSLFCKTGFKIVVTQGYISRQTCRLIETLHYPALIQVFLNTITHSYQMPLQSLILRQVQQDLSIKLHDSSCYFILVQKPS